MLDAIFVPLIAHGIHSPWSSKLALRSPYSNTWGSGFSHFMLSSLSGFMSHFSAFSSSKMDAFELSLCQSSEQNETPENFSI